MEKPEKPRLLEHTSKPTNCQKSVSTSSHKQGAVQKKIAQHSPRRRGQPRKSKTPKTPSPIQKTPESATKSKSQDEPQDLYGVLIDIKNKLGEVKEKQELCHDDLCDVMDTRMSDFKQSLRIEINNVKENVGKNTVVLTH